MGLIAASTLALLAVASAIVAVFGFQRAREAANEANRQTEIAVLKTTDAYQQATIAKEKTAEALRNESVALATLSTVALDQGYPADAVQLALAAWPRTGDADRPMLKRTVESFKSALAQLRQRFVLQHSGPVLFAAFSPDSTRIVTASRDGMAHIWDSAKGTQIALLKGHEQDVLFAAFSPDGRRVVTASEDKTARIWNANTGGQITVLKGHQGAVFSAAFLPDGTRIVTASRGQHRAHLGCDDRRSACGSERASRPGLHYCRLARRHPHRDCR